MSVLHVVQRSLFKQIMFFLWTTKHQEGALSVKRLLCNNKCCEIKTYSVVIARIDLLVNPVEPDPMLLLWITETFDKIRPQAVEVILKGEIKNKFRR